MTNKEMLQKMMNTLEEVNSKITAIDKRVTALEKGKPSASGKGNSSKEEKAKFSITLADYEPKKDSEGNYNFYSHKAQRKAYCYAVASNGKTNKFDKEVEIDFSEGGKYYKAKADFDKKFPYKKKADR